MVNRIRKKSNEISDLANLVIKSMVLIVVVILVAKALLPLIIEEPFAKYGSYLLGITSLFVIVVSKSVRDEIIHFGKKKPE